MKLSWGRKSRNRAAVSRAGFSLVELLVTIGILSMIIGLAVWSLQGTLPNWRLNNAASEVTSMFQYARSEAARNNVRAFVSFSGIGSSTASKIDVYLDVDRNGNLDAADTLLKSVTIPMKYPRAYIASVTDAAGAITTATMRADGTMTGVTAPVTVTVDSLATTTPSQYSVVVILSGAARVEPVP
ncbi:MAG: GspH/FimT family pseudopilin [Nitrospinae bacterium]|nr:GspH/FimT family pseudopilin [Nitrospinota bacterium]